MARAKSVWACLLGMTEEDVRAAKNLGIEVDDIFHFWRKRTLRGMKRSFGFTDGMWEYLKKRWFVQIPGGVILLKEAKNG